MTVFSAEIVGKNCLEKMWQVVTRCYYFFSLLQLQTLICRYGGI